MLRVMTDEGVTDEIYSGDEKVRQLDIRNLTLDSEKTYKME